MDAAFEGRASGLEAVVYPDHSSGCFEPQSESDAVAVTIVHAIAAATALCERG